MSSRNSFVPRTIVELGEALRLESSGEVQAFLDAGAVREAYRIYRNRCLVSSQHGASELPDWKDVDEYVYEMQMTAEFRQWHAGKRSLRITEALVEYVEMTCREKPYELKPHVVGFVLRIDAFWSTPLGARFNSPGGGDGSRREAEFDRYIRIMKLMRFMVQRDT
ncbi:hypothetical protein GGS21DRAFT_293059 [Xylaria nigripes]|nr:hypothetical protein GGS21DRAFT_293059 [Xylaria nigripes]